MVTKNRAPSDFSRGSYRFSVRSKVHGLSRLAHNLKTSHKTERKPCTMTVTRVSSTHTSTRTLLVVMSLMTKCAHNVMCMHCTYVHCTIRVEECVFGVITTITRWYRLIIISDPLTRYGPNTRHYWRARVFICFAHFFHISCAFYTVCRWRFVSRFPLCGGRKEEPPLDYISMWYNCRVCVAARTIKHIVQVRLFERPNKIIGR